MASPFPGMDPYLESPAYWSDFHSRFINYWCEALADALPAAYSARIGERVYLVEQPPVERKLIYTDVAVERDDTSSRKRAAKATGVATLEPVTLPLPIQEESRETYIEILHRPDRALIAVLELLSPANKEEPGRGTYLTKRKGLLGQQVHLIELDLLLGGQRSPLRQTYPDGDYFYLLARAERRPDCQVYHWTMREPLPTLPVPLRGPDKDLLIDLGAVFATAYARGRYEREIDYEQPADAPLTKEQKEWVAAHLRAARP
ncbi:MAG: DUF4058 family protein [Gemmataceae bacterium]|nr:DUF4058 family protein [Gemmataceae bacterium]